MAEWLEIEDRDDMLVWFGITYSFDGSYRSRVRNGFKRQTENRVVTLLNLSKPLKTRPQKDSFLEVTCK